MHSSFKYGFLFRFGATVFAATTTAEIRLEDEASFAADPSNIVSTSSAENICKGTSEIVLDDTSFGIVISFRPTRGSCNNAKYFQTSLTVTR